MTLIGIQRRYSQAGRIRLGEKKTKNGRSYPSKLETFRLTSPSKDAITAAAERYGGSVEAWEDQWAVITDTDRLEVMLPPSGGPTPGYSLHYELWAGGGCQRRCDGANALIAKGEQLVESECLCDPDNRECKPTLRVGFFLPDLPGFGVWRLDSTGYNASAELPGMLDLLASFAEKGRMVRAVLRLEQRTSKRGGQTRKYAVPVVELPYSLAELTGGEPTPLNGHPAPQLTTSPRPRATQHAEPVADEEAAEAPPTPVDAPPAPQSPPDEPLTDDQLERWRAGTHAAMRERIPEGADEHEALRALATAVVNLGDRSLNDLTLREWGRLAHAIAAIPKSTAGPGPGGSSPEDTPGPASHPERSEQASDGEAPNSAPPDEATAAGLEASPAVVPEPADGTIPPGDVSPATSMDDATRAVMDAASKRGITTWERLDALASQATGKPPDAMTVGDWAAFGAELAAGLHDQLIAAQPQPRARKAPAVTA